jgi:outer membrane receptor protein involved in Fe transport
VRDLPGWQLFRRSDARSANPTSQGLTARGMGGNAASRALLILDGVPQSDPFGGWVNWTAFDSLYLKGMRIIDGGGSGADGPGALAGTIQISTRRGGSHASSGLWVAQQRRCRCASQPRCRGRRHYGNRQLQPGRWLCADPRRATRVGRWTRRLSKLWNGRALCDARSAT